MKSKIVFFLFFLAIIFLGGFFYYTTYYKQTAEKDTVSRAKVVTPKSSDTGVVYTEKDLTTFDSETFTALVPLQTTETLISSMIVDFNNDTFDDQIVILRRQGSQELIVLVGLYSELQSAYERFATIPTGFSSTGALSCQTLDVTGDHKQELVIQGTNDSGLYVMQIYSCDTMDNVNTLNLIGDFSSDGTVFIQQVVRSEDYDLSTARGDAFSVWNYSTDKSETESAKKAGVSQIQREYRYNYSTKKYEYAQEVKVSASRLQSKELSRILDGTVETFAGFLDGLWYMTSSSDGSQRYLYFDYEEKEIIFLNGDTEESFQWETSSIRHNGIYLTAVNSIINSYSRRFNITLTNVDEIKISISDDVAMIIKESTRWDGQYKKTEQYDSVISTEEIRVVPENMKGKTWTTGDDLYKISFDDPVYTLHSDDSEEKGVFSFCTIQDTDVIQFRSSSKASFFKTYYSVRFGTKVVTETIKKKKVEKVVEDNTILILTPVYITPVEIYEVEGAVIQLKLVEEPSAQ